MTHAVRDYGLSSRPNRRIGWPQVADLVQSGAVRHLIAPVETQIAYEAAWQSELHTWLDHHHVRAHYQRGNPRAARTPVRRRAIAPAIALLGHPAPESLAGLRLPSSPTAVAPSATAS